MPKPCSTRRTFPKTYPAPISKISKKSSSRRPPTTTGRPIEKSPASPATSTPAGSISFLKSAHSKCSPSKAPPSRPKLLYIKSLNRSIKALRFVLTNFDRIERYIPNRDLDTGLVVKPGGYSLTDNTYATLLDKITEHPEKTIPIQLKHDITAYYADPEAPIITKKDPQKWAKVQANLKTLETMKTIGELDPLPLEIQDGN